MLYKIVNCLSDYISRLRIKLYIDKLKKRLMHEYNISNFDIELLPYEAWKLEKLLSTPGINFVQKEDGILCTLDGKSLLLTDWNDIFISVDSFVDFDYGFVIPEKKKCVVFDVGANIGDTAIVFASIPDVEKVFSFEPLPSIYNRLQKNIILNPNLKHKIQTFPFGLGIQSSTIDVSYPVGSAYCATCTEEWHKNNPSFATETMEIKDVAKIFKTLLAECANDMAKVIKLDCEGAEFEIIPHLEKYGLLSSFSLLLMEFHRTDPQPIVEILKYNGFSVVWQESRVGLTGRLYATR